MNKKPEGKGNIHQGHRQRAKGEFLAHGLTGLPDHKVLELILFYAIPQGDVNPLAHALVDHFGSLAGVFHATYDQLLEVKGVGPGTATLLQLIPAAAARYMADRTSIQGQIVDSWQFRELLLPLFFGARNEMAYLVCLDGKNKVLACRKLGEGIADEVTITARKVLEVALACNATKVVLAHNHVSGVALCSPADVRVTKELRQLLRQVNIRLEDHFVVADDDMVSMAASGYLDGM